MSKQEEIKVGDTVTFTDEFGKEQESTIIIIDAYNIQGTIGIEGDYGCYVRTPLEVMKVQPKEEK